MFGFHLPNRDISFNRLAQHEDCESLSSEGKDTEGHGPLQDASPSRIWQATIICLVLLTATVLGAWLRGPFLVDSNRLCVNRVSNYSPLLEDVDISFSMKRFNGSFMHENIFRQTGSPEVDAAWKSLGVDYRAAIVPTSLAARSGLIESQVQVSPKYGGGFPANIEGLHHLHCLNLLRQGLWFNYDYYLAKGEGAFSNEKHILRVHVTHCLDILRQQLMCNVDIGVLGQVWWNKNQPTAYPDFNTQHKCRNFKDVRKWAEAHQAPKVVPPDFLIPPRSLDDVYETMP